MEEIRQKRGLVAPSHPAQALDKLQQKRGLVTPSLPSKAVDGLQQTDGKQQAEGLDPAAASWHPNLKSTLLPATSDADWLEEQHSVPEGWKKHKCELCGHMAHFVLDIWKHKTLVHGECLEEDFLLYVFAEQNFEMGERLKRLQESVLNTRTHEGATVADVVESQAQAIINSIKVNKRLEDLENKTKNYITNQVKQQTIVENISRDVNILKQLSPPSPFPGMQPPVAPKEPPQHSTLPSSRPFPLQPSPSQPATQARPILPGCGCLTQNGWPGSPPQPLGMPSTTHPSPQPSPQPSPSPLPQQGGLQQPRLQAWAQAAAPTRFEVPPKAPTSQLRQPFSQHSLIADVRPKIAYITDSIGANVNFDMLEKATGAEVKKMKAYCSKFDGKIPTKNFTDVVPKVMGSDKFEYLVVQASSTDLTNLLNLPEGTVDEYYRQQASLSSYQMVASIDSALTSHPSLKGAVLMERAPRYDDLHDLNHYANGLLHEAVARSRNINKIFIGQHTLECDGGMRASRFGTPSSHHNYDGIHMRGTSGKMAYTRSVANIFQHAGILSSPLKVVVPKMTSRPRTNIQECFQPANRKRGFSNPARRQESFQSAGRSQGVFQLAQQQHERAPPPLMEQEVTIPTHNRFQGFW